MCFIEGVYRITMMVSEIPVTAARNMTIDLQVIHQFEAVDSRIETQGNDGRQTSSACRNQRLCEGH